MSLNKLLFSIIKKNKLYVLVVLIIGQIPILNIFVLQLFLGKILKANNQIFNIFNEFICLYVLISLTSFFLNRYAVYQSEVLQLKTGSYLVDKIISSSLLLTLEEFEQSEYQNKFRRVIENSLGRLVESFSMIISATSIIITLLLSIIYLAQWNIFLVVVFILLPFVFYKSYIKIVKVNYDIDYNQTEKKKENWYITFLLTQDNAFKENKIFSFSEYLMGKYKENVKSFLNDSVYAFKLGTILSLAPEISGNIVVGIFLYFIAFNLENGSIKVDGVVAIIQLAYTILDISKKFVSIIISLKKNKLYIDELIEIMNLDKGLICNENVNIDYLTLRKVSFEKNNKVILNNINLELEKGIYFLIGSSGEGKTTLLNLISGLYSVKRGDILINNKKVVNNNILRNSASVLFQDFKKYELSLVENIILGDTLNLNDDDLVNSTLESVFFLEETKKLPKGFKTNLGSWFKNSQNLSGGEWQRIALARAIYKNASLYLFDEPSSMLDYKTSKQIIKSLRSILKDKIVVIVTHQISMIEEKDNVIFLKNGSVFLSDKYYKIKDNIDFENFITFNNEKLQD